MNIPGIQNWCSACHEECISDSPRISMSYTAECRAFVYEVVTNLHITY